jgi:tRNA nucleotidyltransferase (CCA-adding enzyme)
VTVLSERLRVPTDCKGLAELMAKEHGNIHRSQSLNARAVMRLLERCDAWRRAKRFLQMLLACECDARGRLGLETQPYPQRLRLQQALQSALAVNTAAVAQAAMAKGKTGPAIGVAIRAARAQAVQTIQAQWRAV